MAFYWCFRLSAIAEHILYLDRLAATESMSDVLRVIEAFRNEVVVQPRTSIPL